MIVVTTPTGHIGSLVVQHLLSAGESVRVIARDPSKMTTGIREAVDVVQGSTDDEDILSRAFKGASDLFWVVPPPFRTDNLTEYYLNFTKPACRAIKSQGVKRVVSVSALGRGIPVNAGPVTAAFASDAAIESTGVNFRALWCPSFMENLLNQVQSIKNDGVFVFPGHPDLKAPHAATQDIAASAAKLVLDKSWTGQGGLAVLGPEDLSFNDLASVMTEVLQKPIRFQQVPGAVYKDRMLQFGASQAFAQGIVDMFAAKNDGLDNAEPRGPENTTPTTFWQWCEMVLKPAVLT